MKSRIYSVLFGVPVLLSVSPATLWSIHPADKLTCIPEGGLTSIEQPSRLKADLALAFCSLLWGTTFVVVKNALDHASVFIFLAVRFTVAAVLMLAFSTR